MTEIPLTQRRKTDGVNESDENGKISNLLDPVAKKQTFGRKSQNWPNLRDKYDILLILLICVIIAKLGLCISVYDIESIDGGFIFPNEGAPTYTVKFRLIIFRPFVGEIISARLKESNADGLRLSLGFFEDIYIPELLMPEPSEAEPDSENKGQVKWTWVFNDEKYLIDGVDEIRFRVQNIKFPDIPKEQKDPKPFAPMEIIGSLVSEGGLGPVSWWV